jgi:hypothetical protein
MKGWEAMKSIVKGAALGLLLAASGAGAAIAGSGNVLYLVQTNTGPDINSGNQFFSDQSAANYSSIGQVGAPATQTGERNDANLTIKSNCSQIASDCGTLGLTQDNSGAGLSAGGVTPGSPSTLSGNIANVTILGQGTASISQLGDNNLASVKLDDGDANITQKGLDNSALLTLQGDARGIINQLNGNNTAKFTVKAVNGATVQLNQNGGVSYEPTSTTTYDPGTTSPIAVSTNGSVTISQYQM